MGISTMHEVAVFYSGLFPVSVLPILSKFQLLSCSFTGADIFILYLLL